MIPPILHDFPESFETERLIIRIPRAGDGLAVNAAILENIEELQQWMPWAHPAPAAEDTEIVCRQAYSRFIAREDFHLQLWLKDSGIFIGSSGLHPRDWAVPSFEIGYWCRKQFQGQGYITEAVHGITRFGFETVGARRIFIRCDARNTRSRRVAERAGYELEAELRNDAVGTDGELRNTLIFARLKNNYDATSEP